MSRPKDSSEGHVAKMFALAGLLLACSIIHGCDRKNAANKGLPSDTTTAANTASIKSQDSLTIELSGQDSVTVFDLLNRTHTVESKSTSMGVFVTAIDSVTNGSSAYWVYSVNDTSPKIASDKMFTRSGDRVVWHFRVQ